MNPQQRVEKKENNKNDRQIKHFIVFEQQRKNGKYLLKKNKNKIKPMKKNNSFYFSSLNFPLESMRVKEREKMREKSKKNRKKN